MASPREGVSFAFEAVPSSSTGAAAPVRIGRPRSMYVSHHLAARSGGAAASFSATRVRLGKVFLPADAPPPPL